MSCFVRYDDECGLPNCPFTQDEMIAMNGQNCEADKTGFYGSNTNQCTSCSNTGSYPEGII